MTFGETNVFRLKLGPGDLAPDFAFQRLTEGREQKLSDLRGKIVVLEFWAVWCGFCQSSMDRFQGYPGLYPQWAGLAWLF